VFGYNALTGMWVSATSSSRGFVAHTGAWAAGWHVAAGDLDGDGRTDLTLYDPLTGLGFRCFTVAPGVFDTRAEQWAPAATFVGRDR
jgi:hypothetical protein